MCVRLRRFGRGSTRGLTLTHKDQFNADLLEFIQN
jgi:hypothetical protein